MQTSLVYDIVTYHPMDVNLNGVDEICDSVNVPQKMIVTAEVSHTGFVNRNKYFYNPDYAEMAAKSFTKDYNKPVLTHHGGSMFSQPVDPIGRVIDSWYVQKRKRRYKNEPMGAIIAKMEIVDPDAIQKVLDKRYSTLSIRAASNNVMCSICGEPVNSCEHERGEYYGDNNDKLCYWIIDNYTYREVSFVNIPSDVHAQVVSTELSDGEAELTNQLEVGADVMILVDSVMFRDDKDDKIMYPSSHKTIKSEDDGKISLCNDENQSNKLTLSEEIDMEGDYKKLFDDASKVLELNQKSLDEANAAIDALKTERDEILDKLNEATKTIDELKSIVDEKDAQIEEATASAEHAMSDAKEFILEKIAELKDEIGMDFSDERENYEKMEFHELCAIRDELVKICDSKSLLGKEPDEESTDDERDSSVAAILGGK